MRLMLAGMRRADTRIEPGFNDCLGFSSHSVAFKDARRETTEHICSRMTSPILFCVMSATFYQAHGVRDMGSAVRTSSIVCVDDASKIARLRIAAQLQESATRAPSSRSFQVRNAVIFRPPSRLTIVIRQTEQVAQLVLW